MAQPGNAAERRPAQRDGSEPAQFNILPDKSGVPAETMRLDLLQYQGTPHHQPLFKSWKDSMDVIVRPHPDPALREEGTAFVRRLKFPRLYCNRRFSDFV